MQTTYLIAHRLKPALQRPLLSLFIC